MNGQPADGVLGQGDFTRSAANDDNQDGTPDGSPSARTFDGDGSVGLPVFCDGDRLFVSDGDNHRVLIFNSN